MTSWLASCGKLWNCTAPNFTDPDRPHGVGPLCYLLDSEAPGETQAPLRGGELAQSRWLSAVNRCDSPSRSDQQLRGDDRRQARNEPMLSGSQLLLTSISRLLPPAIETPMPRRKPRSTIIT